MTAASESQDAREYVRIRIRMLKASKKNTPTLLFPCEDGIFIIAEGSVKSIKLASVF
jgi:hypothetical protein